ncbi:hypothetical protein P3133_000893 [Salmonella enterica]|nr:hypothetical protein [Salmonella enterica]ELM5539939.1 hypothetical protein [Salmonella enterica]
MANNGFNSKDIEEFVARHTRVRNKKPRKTTSGIPCFVPPAQQPTPRAHNIDTDSEPTSAEIPEIPPPAKASCFSQADIDEFLARKPKKYQMTERDYKELGRNVLLGVGDLIFSSAAAAAMVIGSLNSNTTSTINDDRVYIRDNGELGAGPNDGWES